MSSPISNTERAHKLSVQAEKLDDTGHYREAFKLLLEAAKLGDTGAQINLGNFYAGGKGTKKNLAEAERWYRKAYKAGSSAGANNLACDRRDSGNIRSAILWFKKAVAMGDGGACIELAKIYRARPNHNRQVATLLRRVLRMDVYGASEYDKEQAASMLAEMKK